jgi:hypothetical protein
MYLIYLNELISNKLLTSLQSNDPNIKIGYCITIEKILLDNVIGTKDDFKELVYENGIVERNDNYKN